MHDPDEDREITRIARPADTPGGGESRVDLPACGVGRQSAGPDIPPAAAGRCCGHSRGGNRSLARGPEDRAVSSQICRPAGCFSCPVGEHPDQAVWLCPRQCERVGEGDLRQAAGQVRRVPAPSLHSRVGRRHRTASHRGEGASWTGRSSFVMGVYALRSDETCWFLAVDFDGPSWSDDARAFVETSRAEGVPVALERSRSGEGGHVWIFFATPVPARDARRLGAWLVTRTMERRPEIGFASYGRFYPS